MSKLRRPATPLLLLSVLFVVVGGAVHLREWLETYRHVPVTIPGAAVVRVGFVANAAISALLAVALVGTAFVSRRLGAMVVAAAVLFEASSLGTLIQTRRGSVFGWTEPGWSRAASQTLAIEIGALVVLAAVVAVTSVQYATDRV
jgi:hypothetical protein